MKWQEFTLSVGLALSFTSMPANNGKSQDTAPSVKTSTPVIPEAIKRKEEKLKEKDQVIDSLFIKIDKAPTLLEQAIKEVNVSGKILDNTDRSLSRSLAVLKEKESKRATFPVLTILTPVKYTIPRSKQVPLPEVCPADIQKRHFFQRIFNWFR